MRLLAYLEMEYRRIPANVGIKVSRNGEEEVQRSKVVDEEGKGNELLVLVLFAW